ncbi:hypothetical protein ACLM5H_04950 [Fredinandcohnia humi]
MALVPMKQTIEVVKSTTDDWGRTIPSVPVSYKCRVEEKLNVVKNEAGEEATTTLKILLDKLVDIDYDDTVIFVNELGIKTSRKPAKINVIRDFGGKALLTEVYL